MKYFIAALIPVLMFASCTSSRKPAVNEPVQKTASLSETLLQKQIDGIDFFAKGNVPASWTLEIEFGNLIRFKAIDGTTVTSTAVQPQFLPEQMATSYTSKATSGDIEILVQEEACTDQWSGEKYDKKVVVTVNNKRYEGCGQYLFDPKLNGKWILHSINNTTLVASDFAKGLPFVSMLLQERKITGQDGCNIMNGSFDVLGSKIKFNPLVITKMACPGNKVENEIAPLLSGQTVDYYFNNSQLFFYLQDDSIIVFNKG